MDLCLQVAGDGDIFPMLAIYAPYVRDTAITFEYEVPTAAEFGARLHHVLPEYPWLVCRAPGQVLGYAYAHRHMERAAYGWNVECSVYVLGSARGRGVGRALYGALLELLRLQGVVNAYGCIAVPNEASEALHRTTGFSDARRDNSPPGGVITPSKSLLHSCQQNYKNEGRGNFPPPCFYVLRRCLVNAGSQVAACSSCGLASGFSPLVSRATA